MVTTIRFPDKLHKELKAEAVKRGMTLNAYLIGVLWDRKTTEENITQSGRDAPEE